MMDCLFEDAAWVNSSAQPPYDHSTCQHCPALYLNGLVLAHRSGYLSIDWVPGLFTDSAPCSASLQPPSPDKSQSNSSSTAGRSATSATPVPGSMEWFGELGIGLPLLQNVAFYLTPRVCYWRLNWGRILLQNVSVMTWSNYRLQFYLSTNASNRILPTSVPETGELQDFTPSHAGYAGSGALPTIKPVGSLSRPPACAMVAGSRSHSPPVSKDQSVIVAVLFVTCSEGLFSTMWFPPRASAGFGPLLQSITRYPGPVAHPLVAVAVVGAPAGGSDSSSTLASSTSAPFVFDVGLLLNPPKSSVDSWVLRRQLVLVGNAVWPSPQQLSAQVAAAGGTLSTGSNGLQVSDEPVNCVSECRAAAAWLQRA
jgi:hypothetical protein